MADRHPILVELLGEQLDAMERVLARGRAGKHVGDAFLTKGVDHHIVKADGHLIQAGVFCSELDAETGESHLAHAALRILMADATAKHVDVDTTEAAS